MHCQSRCRGAWPDSRARKAVRRTCRFAGGPESEKMSARRATSTEIHTKRETNLVASGVTQTGEQRGEFATDGRSSVLLEDDLVESTCGGNLGAVQSETMTADAFGLMSNLTLVWLLINRFAVVST